MFLYDAINTRLTSLITVYHHWAFTAYLCILPPDFLYIQKFTFDFVTHFTIFNKNVNVIFTYVNR